MGECNHSAKGHNVTLSGWGDNTKFMSNEKGLSRYDRKLCVEWQGAVLRNLSP